MKKTLFILSIMCVLITSAVVLSACGAKTEPIFVKNLICASDMDVDIKYMAGKSWGKKVKKVDIPNLQEGMSVSLYSEEVDFETHTIHLGINSKHLSEDYGLAEPFRFSKVKVTWDDGTSVMADIGKIQIKSIKEGNVMTNVGEASSGDGKHIESKFQALQDVKIVGLKIPYKKQLEQIYTDIKINNVLAEQISEENPLLLSKGDSCHVSYTAKNTSQYGDILVEAQLIGKDKQGKKQVTVIRFFKRI